MSHKEGGDGEIPHSFLFDDHYWNFSNSDNSRESEQLLDHNKNKLQLSTIYQTTIDSKKNMEEASKGVSFSKDEGEANQEHEIHIVTERERRKKMRDMFSKLHELLPELPAKVDKATIVDEAVTRIKTLEQTLQLLQKKKHEKMQGMSITSSFTDYTVQPQETELTREAFLADRGKNLISPMMNSPSVIPNIPPQFSNCFQTWTSPNLVMNINGADANIFISTSTVKKAAGFLSNVFAILEKHQLEVVATHVSSDYSRTTYMIHANASKVPGLFLETSAGIGDVYMSAITEILPWLST